MHEPEDDLSGVVEEGDDWIGADCCEGERYEPGNNGERGEREENDIR